MIGVELGPGAGGALTERVDEEKNLLLRPPFCEEFFSAIQVLPKQLENLAVMGPYEFKRALEIEESDIEEQLERALAETRKEIAIPTEDIEFPLQAMGKKIDLEIPPVLTADSIVQLLSGPEDFREKKAPRKIIQLLIARSIMTQLKPGPPNLPERIRDQQAEILTRYFQLITVHLLHDESWSWGETLNTLSFWVKKYSLSRAIENWVRQGKIPGCFKHLCRQSQPPNINRLASEYARAGIIPLDHVPEREGVRSWIERLIEEVPSLDYYTTRTGNQLPYVFKKLMKFKQGKEDILLIIFFMAIGKWAQAQERLLMYKEGTITVKDQKQELKNKREYWRTIIECSQFAQSMKNEFLNDSLQELEYSTPQEIVNYLGSVAADVGRFCQSLSFVGYGKKFTGLVNFIESAQKFLTEETWQQLGEVPPVIISRDWLKAQVKEGGSTFGFRQVALSHSGQREQP